MGQSSCGGVVYNGELSTYTSRLLCPQSTYPSNQGKPLGNTEFQPQVSVRYIRIVSMDEEPTLPLLPAVTWDEASQSFNARKRGRRGNAPPRFSNSSDPAVFSSDDDPALDNYVHGRRKKRYVGAWFSQLPTSSDSTFEEEVVPLPLPKPKRTLERQLDSGVWMGGDDTDVDADGDDMPSLAQEILPPPQQRQRHIFQRVPSLRIGNAEIAARHTIQLCIDNGREDIDLS